MSTSEIDLNRAEGLFWEGKPSDALAVLVPEGEPKTPELRGRYYLIRANCELSLGQLHEAEWSLRMARGFDPANRDVRIAEEVLRVKRDALATSRASEFDLAKVADELTRERPLVKPGAGSDTAVPIDLAAGTETDSVDERLVSDTLAGILVQQGKLAEAKKVYIQLARKDPRQFEVYQKKIEAIDSLLDG